MTCLNGLLYTELKNQYSESLFFESILPSEQVKQELKIKDNESLDELKDDQ